MILKMRVNTNFFFLTTTLLKLTEKIDKKIHVFEAQTF